MDATAQQLTDIKFTERKRGYDPDEVDNFLEKLGDAVVKLQEKVREANRRADDADQRAVESLERAEEAARQTAREGGDAASASGNEDEITETLKKTLLLAQKTADEAVKEARDESDKIVAAAKQRSAKLLEEASRDSAKQLAAAEAEVRRRTEEEAQPLREQITELEVVREQLVGDVERLEEYVEKVRGRLRSDVDELVDVLDDPGKLRLAERPELEAPPRDFAAGKPTGTAASVPEVPSRDSGAGTPTGTAASVPEVPSRDSGAGTPEVASSDEESASAARPEPVGADSTESGFVDEQASTSGVKPPDVVDESAGSPTTRASDHSSDEPAPEGATLAGATVRTAPTDPIPVSADAAGADTAREDSPAEAPTSAPSGAEAGASGAHSSATSTPADAGSPTQEFSAGDTPADDDGFLDELKKAVTDESPLGPADPDADAAMAAFFEQEGDQPRKVRFGRRP